MRCFSAFIVIIFVVPVIKCNVLRNKLELTSNGNKLQALVHRLNEQFPGTVKHRSVDQQQQLPLFMIELYRAVSHSSDNNPYNASIVRCSFIHCNNLTADVSSVTSLLYLHLPNKVLSSSSTETSEFIIEAELHLYLRPVQDNPPHTNFYQIKIYQVLPNQSLDEPHNHKLLSVRLVDTSVDLGWQIFNVREALDSWRSGDSPDLGLLVVTTHNSANDEPLSFEFVTDVDSNSEQLYQPILVLFNTEDDFSPNYPEVKKRDAREVKESRRIVSRQRSLDHVLTSMDIYQRAVLRQQQRQRKPASSRRRRHNDISLLQDWKRHRRHSNVSGQTLGCSFMSELYKQEPCARRSLEVSFADIGLTSIIAPKSYDAYQCRGQCGSPLSQDLKPTNHATIQSIMYEMNLVPQRSNEDFTQVDTPSCVPIKLAPVSVLYNDLDKDEIILKSFPDMVVVSCGCR